MIWKWSMPFTFFAAMARSAWAKLRGYEILASSDRFWERDSVCEACPFQVDEQCTKCGCFVAAKIALNLEKCPLDKWPRIWIARKRQK